MPVGKTEGELCWAAGLFEGEGTIRINKPTGRNTGHLVCSVVNTDREVVVFFQARWPGYMKRATGLRDDQREAWVWTVAARQAERFLLDVLPYLYTERVWTKAQWGLAFQSQKSMSPSVNRSPEYKADQWDFYDGMRAMNQQGIA